MEAHYSTQYVEITVYNSRGYRIIKPSKVLKAPSKTLSNQYILVANIFIMMDDDPSSPGMDYISKP